MMFRIFFFFRQRRIAFRQILLESGEATQTSSQSCLPASGGLILSNMKISGNSSEVYARKETIDE